MKTTAHFEHRLAERSGKSGLTRELAVWIVNNASRKFIQPNGRIQFDAFVPSLNIEVRVVLLKDAETFHTIFPIVPFREQSNED